MGGEEPYRGNPPGLYGVPSTMTGSDGTVQHPFQPYEDPPVDVSKIDRKAASALQKSLALWLQTSQYRPSKEESWALIKPVRNFGFGLIGGTVIAKPLLQQFLPPAATTPAAKLWLLAALVGGYPIGFVAAASTVRHSICELLQDKTPLAMQARYLYRSAENTKANLPPPPAPPMLVPVAPPYSQARQWPQGGTWPPYGGGAAAPPSQPGASAPGYWDDGAAKGQQQQQIHPNSYLTWNQFQSQPPRNTPPSNAPGTVDDDHSDAGAYSSGFGDGGLEGTTSLETEADSAANASSKNDGNRYRSWDSIRRAADCAAPTHEPRAPFDSTF